MHTVVATITGLVAMIATILVIETAGHAAFPTGEGPDMAAVVAAMPLGAKLVVMLGWFLGPLIGAWIAARMTPWRWVPWIVVGFAVVGGVATVIAIPHPWWMVLGSVAAPLAGLAAGTRLAGRPTP